ncbi:hypothetical protein K9N68_13615 [Kovacikia minuta CCNUW1]|uniref:hypothetical protein n=1 Tax=Kovacikia minuta TaxID=2931930 RepID=UPI001CCC69FA|nr:hypothetical protein [Kovacikia minuta]UBF28785.1 hypothetical protein K9N68_13615 [Kovacikia minuta CCNUW1]
MAILSHLSVFQPQPSPNPTKQVIIQSNLATPPVSPTPPPISGNDVVNIIIAISVLVGLILGKSTKSQR